MILHMLLLRGYAYHLKMMETERDRTLKVGDKLCDRIVGQYEAIEVVTEAMQK